MTDEEFENLAGEEMLAGVTLQGIETQIKTFKKQFRWKEARRGLAVVLRRNLPRGQR